MRHDGRMSAAGQGGSSDAESVDTGRKLDLLEEIGGPQGIADSSIPAIVFVAAYSLGGNRITFAGICALVAGLAITIVRLAKGESLRFALAGFVGAQRRRVLAPAGSGSASSPRASPSSCPS